MADNITSHSEESTQERGSTISLSGSARLTMKSLVLKFLV